MRQTRVCSQDKEGKERGPFRRGCTRRESRLRIKECELLIKRWRALGRRECFVRLRLRETRPQMRQERLLPKCLGRWHDGSTAWPLPKRTFTERHGRSEIWGPVRVDGGHSRRPAVLVIVQGSCRGDLVVVQRFPHCLESMHRIYGET